MILIFGSIVLAVIKNVNGKIGKVLTKVYGLAGKVDRTA